ncbi:MAG: threonine synthase [Candidatus Buchananbacteria bacterium]|nr:threonine synthase [Candidatus Buchananbacteria bacterium]
MNELETSFLSCIGCGRKADVLTERAFSCPDCGNLYDMIVPVPLHHRPADWKALFARKSDFNSGVWDFKPWVAPDLSADNIVSIGEGLVPLVEAGRHLKEYIGMPLKLWLSLRGKNPTGSFKDDGMTVLVSIAKAGGVEFIACVSTGDTSASLAAFCAHAGIKCTVILPAGKITPEQLMQVRLFGAQVILLPGTFDDCMRVFRELVKRGVYPGNSLNPARIQGHQTTVFQAIRQFGWKSLDVVFVPIGNGSNASSVGKALRLLTSLGFEHQTRIIGCQSNAANPLAISWPNIAIRPDLSADEQAALVRQWLEIYQPVKVGETMATAMRIGDPVSKRKVMREIIASNGAILDASDQEAYPAVLACAKDGHFVCPQSGVALAGLKKAVSRGLVHEGETVVVICTADGLKFSQPFLEPKGTQPVLADDCQPDTVARLMKL